jgi:class III lanthionine synthetase
VIDQYELYCMADRLFYDALRAEGGDSPAFPIAARPVPEGWDHVATDTWLHYAPRGAPLPSQGWKIHVSSCVQDAERALTAVWDYCTPRGISFKFLRNEATMVMLNSKSAFRASSGKLVTIYPRDEAQLQVVLADLDEMLAGVRGPYVLSDLRYGQGPLFLRYGGFSERRCLDEAGERVLAIEDGEGRLVPDVRGPTFAVPPWVSLPAFLEPHLAARNAVRTDGLPYRIESVMHFSNGGGVYLGRELRTGERVVLKEGRPHAGLDAAGRDAVTRLGHERDILERLAGLDVVPALIDYFTLGEHHFLVEEFVDGNPLQRMLVHRYPLTHPDCPDEAIRDYTEWALTMLERVEDAVAAIHERGVVFGDLHPENVLVTADGRIALIDFEVATLAQDRSRPMLSHPGYVPSARSTGAEVDRYALACLAVNLFAPQTTMLLPLHPGKARHLAKLATEMFPGSAEAVGRAVPTLLQGADADDAAGLEGLAMPGSASWVRLRAALQAAILASATPDRKDRLFPGDILQFQPAGGVNLAHGAAGVLYAMAATGAGRFPEHEVWLLERVRGLGEGSPVGFYDGLHGVAYVLDELGYRQDALDVVDLSLREDWGARELGLYSGLAGVALSLLHFGDRAGEAELQRRGHRLVDIVAERLGGPEDVPEISGGSNPRAGLMHGSSGPALLFLRAYERTGDAGLLDQAAIALRQDLRRCVQAEDGTVQVNQDWRTLPYLDEGSVGIALVLARYLVHRDDESFADALDRMELVTRSGYFVQSGLFTGRAGMIAHRGMRSRSGGSPPGATDPATRELVRWLRWHALPYRGGLAFPGDQLMRLSMDFATGTAGVLFALGAALHDRPLFLPFFEPSGGEGGLTSPPEQDAERRQLTSSGRR